MSPSQCRITGRAGLREQRAVDGAVVVGARRAPRASARLAIRITGAPSPSTNASCSSYARRTSSSVAGRRAAGRCRRRQASCPPTAFASATERRISSCVAAQSRPIPRWAVSIASATRSPCDHRCRRKCERRLPVQLRRTGRIAARQRVGDDVRRGVARPASAARRRAPAAARARRVVVLLQRRRPRAAARARSQRQLRHVDPAPLAPRLLAQLVELDAARALERSPTGTARRARRGAGTAPTGA